MELKQTKNTQPTVLSGWKEIARYLGRGVRTVQRWEQLGLPVSRPNGHLRSSVCTTTADVDDWLLQCRSGRNRAIDDSESAGCAHVHELSELKREVARLNTEIDELRRDVAHEQRAKVDRLSFPLANSKPADA